MPNSPSPISGLEMPVDFPVTHYEAIHSRMVTKKDTQFKSWYQYGSAWNAVAYRFLSCTEYSTEFTNSIQKVGSFPPNPERYKQEKDLFGFFITGLATIESLCYGLFAIGSILNKQNFRITSADDLRTITPKKTTEKFACAFNNEPITTSLLNMLDDINFKDWNIIRNILVHRCLPGRALYYVGDSHHGEVLWVENIQIDAKTTVSKRDWLVKTIFNLLEDADMFTNKRL